MSKVIRRRFYDTTSPSPVGGMQRAVSSWLGLALIVFNVLGGFALPARPADAAPQPPLFVQALQDDLIVVCTASGMVLMDRDGNVIDRGGDDGHLAGLCTFCLPLHGSVQPALTVVAAELPPPPRPLDGGFVQDVSPPAPAGLTGAASPRAPPFA